MKEDMSCTVYMRLTCEELDSPKPSNRSVA
jgi:hypothetical protein